MADTPRGAKSQRPLAGPIPTRGTPGGHRDAWDPALDPAVAAMQTEQAALDAAIAQQVEIEEAERPHRGGRRRKPRLE